MALQVNKAFRSITHGSVDGVELPMFTLITGTNGSGKSNLVEALNSNFTTFQELGPLSGGSVRLLRLSDLLSVAEEPPAVGAQYREPWAILHNQIQQQLSMIENESSYGVNRETISFEVSRRIVSSNLASQQALDRMLRQSNKLLIDMTADDLRSFAPVLSSVRDPFTTSLSELFLSYAVRRDGNELNQFRKAKGADVPALSDLEFEERFGRPPWCVLDDTLELLNLPYRFVPPPRDTEETQYSVTLAATDSQLTIKPSELSSGERILLTVAMSLFASGTLSEAIKLPTLLLLDEADASLHPSMIKSLLTVIEEIFVEQYQVRVILITHSPSTVALASPEAVYVMSRQAPRLQHVTVDNALKLLTVGIPTLSVQLENRRQVFVESEHDQGLYQDLFRIARSYIKSERTAEFVAAGKRSSSGGCDAVKRLVGELRAAGICTVSGIIDRDDRQGAPEHVYYLNDRYSIENILLDPLILGTLLLRSRVMSASDLGLPEGTRHFEVNASHSKAIVSVLQARLGFGTKTMACEYAGGFILEIPIEFMEMRGHDLEDLVLSKFLPLRSYKGRLKNALVREALADVPAFIPKSVLDLLETVLQAD